RYDPSTNRWLCNLAPTSSPRDSFGLVALDGSLYAVGGRYHDTSLNVVERYDVRRNEWIYVAPMGTRRHGVTVSVLNGLHIRRRRSRYKYSSKYRGEASRCLFGDCDMC
ncbi:kelch repeat protein, partial [Ostertagia ostertagi]